MLRALLVIAVCVAFPWAAAQTIYIWTDEHGITHFTDREPDTDRPVTVQRAIAEPVQPLEMLNLGSNREPAWHFSNRLHGPLEVEIDLPDRVNTLTVPELPARFVLGALERRELVLIGPLDPARSWRYQIRSRAIPGRPDARPDRHYSYSPPFASGQTFIIGQAFGGTFSHSEPHSYHAVDLSMPSGTAVHAARQGVVMDTARWFHGAGEDRERYGERANYVRIEHADGSMAVYAHLDYDGVLVKPGERVARGQQIGRSGMTGFTTGPHLHFVIQRNTGMALESIPFEFMTTAGALKPAQGQRITAP